MHDFEFLAATVAIGSAVISVGCVTLCVKLYTEFVKEKKYREP